jgi:DNA-binding NarL/FixJ family response regulator
MKVLIAEAQLLVREGLKAILSQESSIDIVCEVSNRKQLERCLTEHLVDVVIIDYAGESKFSVDDVLYIRSRYPNLGVLVISGDSDVHNISTIIENGIQAFLTKECDKDEVISALHAAVGNQKFFCNKVVDLVFSGVVKQAPKTQTVAVSCNPSNLSIRETEILALVGEGLTTLQIADKLNVSSHTVSTHRKNIAKKLNAKSPADLIKYAVGVQSGEI